MYNGCRTIWAIAAALLFLLLTTATALAQAGGASTPSLAVEALVGSFGSGQVTIPECNALGGYVIECPISERLRARLASAPAGEKGNAISRSDVVPAKVEVALVKLVPDATVAQVPTRWEYSGGSGTTQRYITFVVRKGADGWLVDDSYCQNNPASSIYNGPVSPCPAGEESPGTPRTGDKSNTGHAALLLAGLLILILGAWLVQRAAATQNGTVAGHNPQP